MRQTARAYSYNYGTTAYAEPRPTRRTAPSPQHTAPKIGVIPGSKDRKSEKTFGSPAMTYTLIAVGILLLFTAISFARIHLSAQAVSTALAAQEVSYSIEEARTQGNQLEVEQSKLNSINRIKNEATRLGMGPAENTLTVNMPEDIVAYDEDGNLSLILSAERLVNA